MTELDTPLPLKKGDPVQRHYHDQLYRPGRQKELDL